MAKIKFTAGRVDDFKCTSGNIPSFLWDSVAPGLGLRATPAGAKSYIFQAKLKGQVIRITIGDPATWDILSAQKEAARLRVIVNNGKDPRQVKADGLAAEQAAREEKAAARAAAEVEAQAFKSAAAIAALRDAVTLGDVWPEYVADRIATREKGWSSHHIRAHRQIIQAGGEKRIRSRKETEAGPLASMVSERLVDLTSERIEAWAKVEAKVRPSSARLAWRLLKACMNWCAAHKTYSEIVTVNPTKSAKARESLGKAKVRHDVIQREQLSAWFGAVRSIGNPVIAAYLQSLLLTGARREELAALRWEDVNFQWNSIKVSDKMEDFRMVPLTPYVSYLLAELKRRNDTVPKVRVLRRLENKGEVWKPSPWVFSSVTAASGHIAEPRIAHNEAVAVAGMPPLTLHGLRRSFATLCEWTETPAGIAAQIQGHAPQGVREQNYIRRPLDLLRLWHVKFEAWILEQAGIEFQQEPVIAIRGSNTIVSMAACQPGNKE